MLLVIHPTLVFSPTGQIRPSSFNGGESPERTTQTRARGAELASDLIDRCIIIVTRL